MQYLLLINEDESIYEGEAGAKLMEEVIGQHMGLAEALVKDGVEFSGNRLQPGAAATTIKWENGNHVLHDGPFSETHEELGGYYLIDVPDLDAALKYAKMIPIPGKGAIEVRPIWEME